MIALRRLTLRTVCTRAGAISGCLLYTSLAILSKKMDFFKDVEVGGDVQFQSGQPTF